MGLVCRVGCLGVVEGIHDLSVANFLAGLQEIMTSHNQFKGWFARGHIFPDNFNWSAKVVFTKFQVYSAATCTKQQHVLATPILNH